jgi:hypothetical protein
VVEKKQKSPDENLMFNSFAIDPDNGSYGLVFNEDVRNMSDVAWVTIDSKGNTTKKMIFEKSKDRQRVAPMLAAFDDKGNLFIPAVRFNKAKIIRVSF